MTAAPTTRHPSSDPHARELLDALQVDEMAEGGEAELEEQQELRASAVERRVLAVAVRELGRLLQRLRPVQVEGRQRHATPTAAVSESTSSAASMPSPILTGTPRSAIVRPSAPSPTTGNNDLADGPMWPMRTRLPAP